MERGCISARACRVGGIISASCSLVCSVNSNHYLRVQPSEPLWVDIDLSAQWDVESNTNWNIL